jgi:hypothetical protein
MLIARGKYDKKEEGQHAKRQAKTPTNSRDGNV